MAEKNTEKEQRSAKRLVKKRKGKISKTGIISKNGRLQIFAKNRRFLTKMGELESLASQRMTLCMLLKTKTVGADLQSTALQSTDDDNDDYQRLPAEFRNRFSFRNVC